MISVSRESVLVAGRTLPPAHEETGLTTKLTYPDEAFHSNVDYAKGAVPPVPEKATAPLEQKTSVEPEKPAPVPPDGCTFPVGHPLARAERAIQREGELPGRSAA